MAGLALSSVSLRDYPSGANVLVLDLDPESYSPFDVPVRGSSTRVLDGTTVHQYLGLKVQDFRLTLQGRLTEIDTFTALWTKYREGAVGMEFELRDWYPNRFRVAFVPGSASFQAVPIPGSCSAHTFTLTLAVLEILEWVGGAY